MIHTVYLDDSTTAGKRFIKELRRYKKGVRFENPGATGVPPEGYMTSEEFRKVAREDLDNICRKHGLLQ